MANVQLKSRIARRLIVYIIAFSSVVTLFVTATQLYYEYDRDVSDLNRYLEQIETGYLSGISEAAWVVDERQLGIILESISNLQDIEYVAVEANDGDLMMEYGFKDNRLQISHDVPLEYRYRAQNLKIGNLQIIAGLEGIYNRLYDRVWITLASNALKTFVVALFVYYLFINLVTRHLSKIVTFTQEVNLDKSEQSLSLDRKDTPDDELDAVSQALNQMVEQLRNTYAELKNSERRHKEIASSIPGVVYQLKRSKEGVYSLPYISEGVQELFGVVSADVGNEPGILFARISVEDIDGFFESLRISATSMSPWFNKFRIKSGNGHSNWVFGSAVPSLEKDGTVCWNGIMLDVTRQKQAEQDLIYATENLEEQVRERTGELLFAKEEADRANLAKTQFLSRMSHELRTPLNVIMGYSHIASRLSNHEEVNTHLNEIGLAAKHLLELIKDVMDLSRIETNDIHIEITQVKVRDVILEAEKYLANEAKQRNITVKHDQCAEDIIVLADGLRIKEVILNLLSNAIKYNRQDGLVDISCQHADSNHVRIEVRDTGKGLDTEQLKSLFQPFSRLGAEFTDIEGTGVGLVITKSLLERMGGTLQVESTLGQGSCFIAILPLYRETEKIDS